MAIVIHKSQIKAAEAPQTPREAKLAGVVIRRPAQARAGVEQIGAGDLRDRYRIDAVIGEGGTGRVLKAYDRLLEMDVAIKVLSPRLVRDREALAALKAEVRITLQLVHQHILRVYTLERSGGNYMVIMEYLAGKSVAELLAGAPGGLALDFVVPLAQVVADALGYAHRHGVLHRDLTPGNVFLTDDGVVKVIDFGIAAAAGAQSAAMSDTVVGTPAYMSPEQIRGDALDARSDIYSLGVLVHQMLTGRVVSPDWATVKDLAFEPHPPVAGLPPALAAVLETATAFRPEGRHPDMGAFARALAEAARPWVEPQPTQGTP